MIPAEQGEDAIAFPPVEVYPTAHDADHAEVPAAPEGVTFLKEQQWKLLAGTQKVAKRPLIERLRLPAQVVARPGSLAQITPPIAGRLIPPPGRAMPMVGDRVTAGEVVAQVQPVFSEFAVRMVEAEGAYVCDRLITVSGVLADEVKQQYRERLRRR